MRLRTGLAFVSAAALIVPSMASAHARVSPPVSISGQLQLYSLAVPTEKSNVTTTKVVLSVPSNFSIDSFAPSPGWQRVVRQSGSADSAVIQQVTWTGGHVPTGEDALFQFLAEPASTGTYRFTVQQTYSDGQVVDWSGSEASAAPAPTISVKSSLGGGSVSVLSIVALILGLLGLLAGGAALAGAGRGQGGRPLA